MPIINSLLDTDLYLLTQMQFVCHQFPNAKVKYKFYCRNESHWTYEMVKEVSEQIKYYCNLQFTTGEISYLSTLSFFKKNFLGWLFYYSPRLLKETGGHIKVKHDARTDSISIEIEGSWFYTILFEVPILAIVNEVYFKWNYSDQILPSGRGLLYNKIDKAIKSDIQFADFGTRRRYSKKWQQEVVDELACLPNFIGTSNVYLAKKFDITSIGTMSHQLIMAGVGMTDIKKSQSFMLQKWVDEYHGDLGIALSDTYGTDVFLKDFDMYFAKLYDGVRQDSGDPFAWAAKMIQHYRNLGIDPKSKTLIFSDGLTVDKAIKIKDYIDDATKVSFGIGTNLTNDFPGITPLNIVIKMTECNGVPTVKLSDELGKEMSESKEQLEKVKMVMGEK